MTKIKTWFHILLCTALGIGTLQQYLGKPETAHCLTAVAQHFDQYPGRDGFLLRNIASSLDAHTDDNTLKQILDWSLSATNARDMAIAPVLDFKPGGCETVSAQETALLSEPLIAPDFPSF